jgi:kinetochore protein Mis12/MTW1
MAKQTAGGIPDEPSTDVHIDLLTEHFGFSPRVFIDDIVDAANEHLYSIAGQFEDYVKQQLRRQAKKNKIKSQDKGANDTEAERGVHTILTLMENALDIAFDALEMYCLKTVFGIRPSQAKYMALAHHRGLDLRTPVEKAKDGDLGAPSADEEHNQLQEREKQLRMQIDKARKLRHALLLANASAKEKLEQTQLINQSFSVLLRRGNGRQQLPSVLPDQATKLSADASSLLRAMDVLIETDSLGTSLLSVGGLKDKHTVDRKRVIDESGASEQEKKEWEQGREQYINWEIDRIYRSVSQQRASDAGNHSRMSISSGLKRRKTDEPTSEAVIIGNTAELEQLAEHLKGG